MKKRMLKTWVVNAFLFIEIFLFMSLSLDHNNLFIFVISKVVAFALMLAIGKKLKNKSNIFEEE
jgi:hypothetical protein